MDMGPLSKRYAALAIAWRHNLFLQARLKLTALYVTIIVIIVCGFSIFLYASITSNLYDTGDDFANEAARAHFLEHTISTLRTTLLLTDLVIIVGAAGVSYWLAGKTLRPVQASLEAQRLFAAHASHELRTPLTVMRNDAEVLLRDTNASAKDLQSALTSTVEEIEKMTQLVENLLILARSEHGATVSERVALSEIIPHTINKLQSLAVQKDVLLTSSVEDSPVIVGNRHALERVLLNLIRNGLEHTPAGGTIIVSAKCTGPHITVQVQDSGVGIHAEDLPHVFERFYKGQSEGEREGSGLGLSIVKEIVEQHGGTIAITSTKGRGTNVVLTFS